MVSNAEGRVEQDLEIGRLSRDCSRRWSTPTSSAWRSRIRRSSASPCERLDAAAENTVYVGDVPAVDVAGARAAGIAPVLLDRHDLYPEVAGPRLRSLAELPALLQGAGGTGSEGPGVGREQLGVRRAVGQPECDGAAEHPAVEARASSCRRGRARPSPPRRTARPRSSPRRRR